MKWYTNKFENNRMVFVWGMWLLCVCQLIAQSSEKDKVFRFDKLYIGYTPSSLLEEYPMVQFSFEHSRAHDSLNNYSLSIGYIFDTPYPNVVQTTGHLVKLGTEHMVVQGIYSALSFGAIFQYKKVLDQYEVNVRYPDLGFTRLEKDTRIRTFAGAALVTHFWFGFLDQRLLLRTGIGLGLQTLKVEDQKGIIPIPEPDWLSLLLGSDNNYDKPGDYLVGMGFLELNISYRLLRY